MNAAILRPPRSLFVCSRPLLRHSGWARARRLRFASWFCLWLVLGVASAFAQTEVPPKEAEDLVAKSLPLRTALYHDPTLAAPLDRLLQIYREANRAKELLDLYRSHVAQYPADTGSQIVLLRLLQAANDPEAGPRIKAAAQQFPDVAYLQFLLFQQLQSTHLADALTALDHAIDMETLPPRKRAWTELLIPQAMTAGRADLAEKHLRAWAARGATPEEKLEVARVMIANRFFSAALETLDAADRLSPSAETGVEIQMTAATAETGLNQGEIAAARLDRLLARLTADYWRRAEILRRRAALVKSDAQREAMLQAARKRALDAPHDEAAALDLAQLLSGFEFRREALTCLLDAGKRLPVSEKIERATLDLLDRLRDERQREEYLSARIQAQPQRQDLLALRVRTLFVLGRRQDALAALAALTQLMDPAARLNHLLELARSLRRSSLPADAAEVFQRVVTLAPDRYEVRRELAETYLALGEKAKARALFANGLPADVPPENLGDVIQFMGKQGLLVEANAALAKRLQADPSNFDLRLLALDLEGKLGNQAEGEKLLDETRALADTGARYRRWLEAGAAFAEVFDSTVGFFDSEQARLAIDSGEQIGEWTKEKLERRLAFADLSARNGRKPEVQEMLRADLNGQMPAEMRVELRRQLVALMDIDPNQILAVQEQLQALAKDDPARADEYRARLALSYMKLQRPDQAMALLGLNQGKPLKDSLDISKISDPALLAGLENILTQTSGDPTAKTAILQRFTEIDPTNRGAWERWIMALGMAGDENHLRQTLRRLLAGIDRMPISAETRELLQQHLSASYWRSIHLLLNDEKTADAALADALAWLDAAEPLSQGRAEWLWVSWTRAYLLNRLGREDARDKAIAEMERIAAERPRPISVPAAKPNPPLPPDEPVAASVDAEIRRITFPDGISIALPDARELLTMKPSAEPRPWRASRSGPLGGLRARWAFETDRRSPVVQILPLENERTLVVDQSGQDYCLDAKTGKLLWTHAGPAAVAAMQPENGSYYGNWTQQVSFPRAVGDGAGRLLIPALGQIDCLSTENGALRWQAKISGRGAVSKIYPTLFCVGEKIIACEPGMGQVSVFDRTTGKLLWNRELPPAKESSAAMPLHALNTGASLSGRRLFIYGAKTAVLDVESGALEWAFDPDAVKELPVTLKETDAPPANAAPVGVPPPFLSGGRRFGRGGFGGGFSPYGGGSPMFAMNYLNASGAPFGRYYSGGNSLGMQVQLAAPAVAWAASNPQMAQARYGLLDGDQLLLFGYEGLRAVRLDLPFKSKQFNGSGTFVGMSGHVACLLQQNVLVLIDTISGETRNFPLVAPSQNVPSFEEETAPIGNGARVQAAVDGPMVYLSRPEGIICVNAQTAEGIFSAPWPANVAPPPPEKPLPQSPQQPQQQQIQAQYLWSGISWYLGQQWGAAYPLVDRVCNGMFLATATASQVVALEQAPSP